MELTTHTRRALSGLAVGGLLTLATAVPAVAIPDPGQPPPDPGGSSGSVVEVPVEVPVDDGALELLQVGLGALGGIAVVGVGAVALSARRQRAGGGSAPHAPHPA